MFLIYLNDTYISINLNEEQILRKRIRIHIYQIQECCDNLVKFNDKNRH